MKINSTSAATPSHSWTGYATALGGFAAVGAAPSANAAILYTDIADLTMSTVNEVINFDLDHSGAGPFAALNGTPTGADFQLRSTGSTDVTTMTSLGGGVKQIAGYYILKLAAGAPVDSGLTWKSGVTYFEFFNTGNWEGGADAYIGLRIQNGVGTDYNYGWAHVNYDDVANQMTLKDFAIEQTVNMQILAGAVPEPSAAVLFALGAGGMAGRRRRKALAA